ncbi:MAG TPA: bifunctional phosphoribosylaminoimidazolecarboxamide formyltransferase/IMP cyclohydrolase [Myxococcota bacterium]|nr:bifunctional phosphoribosylaminoimidazolecarboxamide formyltransferase/IMP cyclohydrolase [Myxococcota bacterium]
MTRRAILSVWDKAGLVELAAGLVELGFELVASGGTSRALRDAGLAAREVEEITGHPEILGGRVKTLHPAVHGGILARRTPEHLAELAAHQIGAFDLVVCNLYPFERTVARPGVTDAEAIEQIDIGGVTLLRAAAKNHEAVLVASEPRDYPEVLDALRDGRDDAGLRRRLALRAFQQTAAYDAAIAAWLGGEALPERLVVAADRVQVLRYGENAHQQGALYRLRGAEAAFEQIGGDKELSYNNVADLEAAWQLAAESERPAVAIIKHANPSGFAVADDAVTAFERAYDCDRVSAFGGIVASNQPVDEAMVDAFGKLFLEVLAAPAFTPGALERLAARKRGCRVMRWTGRGTAPALVIREVSSGLLVQTPDRLGVDRGAWRVVSQRAPTADELRDLELAWIVCKHVRSNAIVFARDEATVGVGAGQMNRVDSVRIAAWRAGERACGSVMASDAFFPFADGVEAAAEAGVTAVVQPGGSVRDEEVLAAVDRLGLAMVVTGTRHFRH